MSLRYGTPIEHYSQLDGLYVKREDLSCTGPNLAKARGVYARVKRLREGGIETFGALDGYHSKNGWVLASACATYGAKAVVFYPNYKKEPGPREAQLRAQELGAELVPLPAGMMSVLWYQARRSLDGHMIPSAMKIPETVEEVAKEVPAENFDAIVVPSSSATIASGVIAGLVHRRKPRPRVIVYMAHSKDLVKLRTYILENVFAATGSSDLPRVDFIDEGYDYRDPCWRTLDLPFPASPMYEMKALDWWLREGRSTVGRNAKTLFWNIG